MNSTLDLLLVYKHLSCFGTIFEIYQYYFPNLTLILVLKYLYQLIAGSCGIKIMYNLPRQSVATH